MPIQVNAIRNTTYYNNQNIRSVNLNNKPWVNNSMDRAFFNCKNLQTVTNINNSVTNISNAFQYCSNLSTTPAIPNSVTNMRFAFEFCTNLSTAPTIPNSVIDASGFLSHCSQFFSSAKYPTIPQNVKRLDYMFASMSDRVITSVPQWCLDKWNNCSANVKTSMSGMFYDWTSLKSAPVIPNSVTDMSHTFAVCTNLTTAPSIPNSVTNMYDTFSHCNALVTAPTIPESVINMLGTFGDCTNLTGNIYIKSENVSNVRSGTITSIFINTTLTKNVYIPFTYDNGVYTKTYNTFISAGYDTQGTKEGVYLKDGSLVTLTVNPTVTTASVSFNTGTVSGKSCTVSRGTTVSYTLTDSTHDSRTLTETVTANKTVTPQMKLSLTNPNIASTSWVANAIAYGGTAIESGSYRLNRGSGRVNIAFDVTTDARGSITAITNIVNTSTASSSTTNPHILAVSWNQKEVWE